MNQRFLILNSRDELFRIDINNIVYFESDGNYTNVHLSNGIKGTVSMGLTAMQELLTKSMGEDARTFARVGKRHIINLRYVYHIAILRQRLTLSDGARFEYTLAVSRDALKSLRELIILDRTPQSPAI